MHTLTQATLADLPAAIPAPRYEFSTLRAGVVRFGPGDRYLHASSAGDRGICGVELIDTPATRAKAAACKAQDCLYTVTNLSRDGTAPTRVLDTCG